MSLGNQNFGFDVDDPVIVGKTNTILFTVADLTAAEVASAEWVPEDINPLEGTPQNQVTKSTDAGEINIVDGAAGLEVSVTLDPADTAALAGGDYHHRLNYVATGGGQHEMARGMGRLTP